MISADSAVPLVGTLRFPPISVCAASAFVLLIVVAAVAPGLIAGDPETVNLDAVLAPPSASHPFGTDLAGRDLYARIVHGTGQSLLIGVAATTVAMLIAIVLGSPGPGELKPMPQSGSCRRLPERPGHRQTHGVCLAAIASSHR